MSGAKGVYRKPSEGELTGVCAGLADYFEVDVNLLRLAVVILTFMTGGFALFAYIAAAIIIPPESARLTRAKINQKETGAAETNSISANLQQLSEDFKANNGEKKLRNFFGLALVLWGTMLLLMRLVPEYWVAMNWRYIFPVALIVIGLSILLNRKGK
jgi:phage shock protein C